MNYVFPCITKNNLNRQKFNKFNVLSIIRLIKSDTYVAFPSRRNTHDSVHSSLAEVIFLVVGLNCIVSGF